MVRILSCHHFLGQRIGKCEEAVGVAVAENVLIVALEHQVNIFTTDKTEDLSSWFTNKRSGISFGEGEFGNPFLFETGQLQNSTSVPPNPNETPPHSTQSVETELRLSHFFAPVDLITSISYNERGHYLLCMERRDTGPGTGTNSVRAYFQWDRETKGKPMKARIAGLVSPTGGEIDDEALVMVEIPPQPLFATKATTSCNLSGNIATLSNDSRVSIYTFKVKQSSGRAKVQYADFDLVCTLHFTGSMPDTVSFTSNLIGCLSRQQVSVVRIFETEPLATPATKRDGFDLFGKLFSSKANSSTGRNTTYNSVNGYTKAGLTDFEEDTGDTVVFNPKDESVKVYLSSITKANRKKRQPNSVIREDFQDDITTNKTTITSANTGRTRNFAVEDLLRIVVKNPSSGPAGDELMQMELYPVRIKNTLGGYSCLVSTSKEAFLYHLPEFRGSFVVRVTSYPFTAPLIRFTFDSLFLHALTDTGLETYSWRGLYYAVKDAEGFEVYKNDCPFKNESPCLLGIRPFLAVRHMSTNKYCICLLTSPTNGRQPAAGSSEASTSANGDNQWTIYSLDLPNIDLLYSDIIRSADLHKDSSPDAYFTLVSELHLILRSAISGSPESELSLRNRYHETCKLIGLEYFKKSTKVPESSESPGPNSEDLIENGVTYLRMGNCDLHSIFSHENQGLQKDPSLIPGITKYVWVTLPRFLEQEFSPSSPSSKFSPTLTKAIVDFLTTNSPQTLVRIFIEAPWIRECQGSRLLPTLRTLAESQKYQWEETLALVLTVVTVHGSDTEANTEVSRVLKLTRHSDIVTKLQPAWLLEKKNNTARLTDLAVCLSMSCSDIHTNVLCRGLKSNELCLSDVVMAFAQGLNLSSEAEVKQGLARTMSSVLENYFLDKLRSVSVSKIPLTSAGQPVRSSIHPVTEAEDEIRALHALVRSYLSHVSTRMPPEASGGDEGLGLATTASSMVDVAETVIHVTSLTDTKNGIEEERDGEATAAQEQGWQLFGKVPSFINVIVKDLDPVGQGKAGHTFPSSESKESFIKLSSLLGSPLGNVKGVHELVLDALTQKGNPNSPVHITLQLLAETPEKAIESLMAKDPTALTLYGKELFGKRTKAWKTLVTKLKEKINSGPPNVDIFSTVIESVYLHLANTLSPSELEEVLDKEEENSKFHSACKRVELANHFTEKVVKMSKEFLEKNQKQNPGKL